MSWAAFLNQVEILYGGVMAVFNPENPYLDILAAVALILAMAFALRTMWHL